MPRRYYSSTAVATELVSQISNTATSLDVVALTGYPAQVPWTAIIDENTNSEEIVTVTGVSGTTLTLTRGVDGSTASSHAAGASFKHGVSGRDFDEANAFVNGGGIPSTALTSSNPSALDSAAAAGSSASVARLDHKHPFPSASDVGAISSTLSNFLVPTGALMPYAGSSAPTGWLMCAGQAVSRSTYADLFTAIGTAYGVGDGSTTFNVPDLRGRVPAGVDNIGGSDAGRLSLANTLGTTAGSQTVTLTESQMPSHTHVQDAHTHTQDSHNHTQNSHNHTQNAHTHTATTNSAGAASGSILNLASQSSGTSIGASGVFSARSPQNGGAGTTKSNWPDGVNMSIPAHTHSVSVTNATPTNQAATATNNATTATNQNTTATNQNTGGGQAHDNMQPTILLNYIIKA